MFSSRSIRWLAPLLICLAASPVIAQSDSASPPAGAAPDSQESEKEEEKDSLSYYIEYSAGLAIIPNQNLTGSGVGLSGRIESEPGYNVGGAIGVRYLENFRGELNLNYRRADIDEVGVQPGGRSATGDWSLFAAMVNAYYDLDLDLGVIPYAGIGIGYGRIELDTQNQGSELKINDEESVFVWNLMVGASMPVGEVVEFTAGYRYLAVEGDDPRFTGRLNGIGPKYLDSEFDSHEIVMGMRMNF